jgi:N-acetylmuramoyl-L-alanine amidase
MLADRPRTVTDGATYFHTRSVRPSWSRKFARTTSIGHHIFYRPATQVAGG